MYTIAKRFSFDASHQLDHLGPDHKCSRLHGHTYTVEVLFQAVILDNRGFVVDYGELDGIMHLIDSQLDHRHLNACVGSGRATTAEALARWLYARIVEMYPASFPDGPRLVAVRVSETPKTWAEWRPV